MTAPNAMAAPKTAMKPARRSRPTASMKRDAPTEAISRLRLTIVLRRPQNAPSMRCGTMSAIQAIQTGALAAAQMLLRKTATSSRPSRASV